MIFEFILCLHLGSLSLSPSLTLSPSQTLSLSLASEKFFSSCNKLTASSSLGTRLGVSLAKKWNVHSLDFSTGSSESVRASGVAWTREEVVFFFSSSFVLQSSCCGNY